MSPTWAVLAVVCAATAAILSLSPTRGPTLAVPLPPGKPAPRDDGRGRTGRLRLLASVAAAAGAAVLVGGWAGLLLAGVLLVGTWHVLGRLEPRESRRRRERLVATLPEVVDLLASCLVAGSSTVGSVRLVAAAVPQPMRDELNLVAGRLDLGADPVRVWADVAGHPQLGPLGRCLVRALDSGAPVSAAMQRLAVDMRRSAAAEVQGRARSIGAKAAAPLGLCLLPAFVLVGVVPVVAASLSGLFGW